MTTNSLGSIDLEASHIFSLFLTMMYLTAKTAYNISLKRYPKISKNIIASNVISNYRWKSSAAYVNGDILSLDKDHANDANDATHMPDFSNSQGAFTSKTNFQLLRATLVYKLCQIIPLVQHAETTIFWCRRIFGDTITDLFLKKTLFGHFCAGEDEDQIKPVLMDLKCHGVGGILDYAAESDSLPEKEGKPNLSTNKPVTYDASSEDLYDQHLNIFLSCISSVRNVAPDGFAAVKVTALGNPKLLERMSTAIVEAKRLFTKFDKNGDGIVSRDEFQQGYNQYFQNNDEDLEKLIEFLDHSNSGYVDYITWSKLLKPTNLPSLIVKCREVGPLSRATPTPEELELIDRLFQRAHRIADEAAACGTRILIDAEQVRFQPAINNLVLELQQKYNAVDFTSYPIIFNTYQCYRKGQLEEIKRDVERSERYKYHFGAKLVRGAYMESERALAQRLQYPSPIQETIEKTHECYDDSVEFLLRHSVQTNQKLEIMCATHNQESIEKAIRIMKALGVDKDDGTVRFGQLYGMSDNLTFNLGDFGYKAYKYVPYGQVKEVIPYLLRRAQENSAITGNASKELKLLREEIKRRVSLQLRCIRF
jgi:proline dehydrogenase